jgi:HipA-like protein
MRRAEVYRNGTLAGILTEEDRRNYAFTYDENYWNDREAPSISLTMPKTQREYRSAHLFPVFFNMLSEGVNKKLQCTQWQIDENDFFGLLLATAGYDTIGALTVRPLVEK